jgi:hypothetical protein
VAARPPPSLGGLWPTGRVLDAAPIFLEPAMLAGMPRAMLGDLLARTEQMVLVAAWQWQWQWQLFGVAVDEWQLIVVWQCVAADEWQGVAGCGS